MLFLKEILGEELFKQFATAVNAYNGNEANKDKQIKLANLASGEYVAKGKHDSLQASFDSQGAELTKANELIKELQKGTKDNEGLQQKITDYETQVQTLQSELQETKIKSAIKVALLSEKAVDVDYLTFKLNESLKEKGEKLELDENDNIKGWDAKLTGLKTKFPNQFESGEGGNGDFTPYGNKGLPNNNGDKTVTKEQFRKMTYEERLKLKQENEKLYQSLRG